MLNWMFGGRWVSLRGKMELYVYVGLEQYAEAEAAWGMDGRCGMETSVGRSGQ